MPFLSINDKKLHYTDSKPEGGVKETFVLTHGLGSSQNFYSAVVSILTKEGFRCITFDTIGSGRSPHVQERQTIETLSDDIIGIIDALGIQKAVLVGHSMGCIVAANLAARQTERIKGSIWLGPVYPSPFVADVFAKRIETVQRDGMEAMANTVPNAAVGQTASPLVRAFIRELLLGQDPDGYISNCRIIATAQPPEYDKIEIPILILQGEEDKSAPLELAQKIYRALGTTEKRLVTLPGVGHWHGIEAYEDVASYIIEFYRLLQE